MTARVCGWLAILLVWPLFDGTVLKIRVPLNPASEVDMAEVVTLLAEASGLKIDQPTASLRLPLEGLAAPLTRTLLSDTLGSSASLDVRAGFLVITLDARISEPRQRPDWERRLRELSSRTTREARRRENYGLSSRESYRPNDPGRPTVCLIHGLNSTSGVFRHLFEPLETAGYGIVVYDFPYNRDLDESSASFRRDWVDFRKKSGDSRPWSIVAHSMGSLLARSYVEDDERLAQDVASMIMIAPPNHGSSLAKAQTVLQTLQSVQALNGARRSDAMALLGDGLGLAADDMTPGSKYLAGLNARRRRVGVRYHIMAGDVGYLIAEARGRLEGRGLIGGFGRLLASGLSASLDEITDGLGDGCVSVASTRLEGVTDHRVLHANHLELIRAPLLFPEAGPVVSMPDILRWLGEDAAIDPVRR